MLPWQGVSLCLALLEFALGCPEGYVSVEAGDHGRSHTGATCLKLVAGPETMAGAIAACDAEGATLGRLDNWEQNQMVQKLKAEAGIPWVMIGLTCHPDDEICWRWHSKSLGTVYRTGYTNWEYDQLTHQGLDCRQVERCAAMGRHNDPAAGRWHDCPCETLCSGTSRLPFICRVDNASAFIDGPDDECVSHPEASFTCSEFGATCCPGTEKGSRCGDCCPVLYTPAFFLPFCAVCCCCPLVLSLVCYKRKRRSTFTAAPVNHRPAAAPIVVGVPVTEPQAAVGVPVGEPTVVGVPTLYKESC